MTTRFVRMTDTAMSGWGGAVGKTNVFVVECDTVDQMMQIGRAAKKRPEMKSIKVTNKHPQPRSDIVYTTRHYNDLGERWKA